MFIRLLRKVHLGIYVFWVVFFFCLFYPFLYFASKNPDRHFSLIVNIRKTVAWLSTFCSGFFYKVSFSAPIDWSRTYVICPNHTSLLDISFVAIICKLDFSFMGKVELLNNPVTRIFFNTIDIPVNRLSNISSYRAFKQAQSRLAANKSVVIFPEGRIDDTYPPILQSFKNGPFKLAIENQVPILPLVMRDVWKLLWDEGRKGSKPGFCRIEVLEPIETHNFKPEDADLLKDMVFRSFTTYLN
ncbi:1-acyl-sn-glycerol-3-phosphate acyltransferase [Olivibacter sp. SDN3]|uniref:lysophospholipid acyltransferase family protein n=1 Tax=Olivibacter sp. SDN3 TaxID=2764720 RepID=UPI0016510FF4|nr:lysophospholipid acyltransferase family protein [Olivibacter sp. SDN3]QNL48686.1 1-acyl-sn-glycerol-3-phosphate acyltransferase [Olivibacter sp. SDN3]